MKNSNIDSIIEENMVLMKKIKDNKEKFWNKVAEKIQKRSR